MKVLIIPSWYPYPGLPHAGSFTINQAQALADTGEVEISLLNWGQLQYQVALRHPLKSIARMTAYLRAPHQQVCTHNRISEYKVKHITWTHHFNNGNINNLIPKLNHLPHYDLIHAHVCYPAGYVAMQLANEQQIPFVITEHSGPFPLPGLSSGGMISPLVTQPLSHAAELVAVSSALAVAMKSQTGRQAAIIPNLIDCDFYKPLPHSSANKLFTLFALSTFTTAKGIMELLEAVRLALASNPNIQLLLAGSGPLERKIKGFITRYRLQDKIVLLGQLAKAQALAYYQTCDCFIMPSRHESFSMVLLEALACGKPVIATACGGPVDIVNPACGVLVPPADASALAQGIINMSTAYRDFNPIEIREYCLQKFSAPVVCRQIIDIYHQVLSR